MWELRDIALDYIVASDEPLNILSSGQIMQDHAGSITQIVWRLCTPYLTVVGPIKISQEPKGFVLHHSVLWWRKLPINYIIYLPIKHEM